MVLHALYRKEALYSHAAQGHILSAVLGALLIAFGGFSLLLDHGGIRPRLRHVGAYSPFILGIYLVAMRAVYQYEQRTVAEFVEEQADRYAGVTLRQAVVHYALAAQMGWEQSFVGTLLAAVSNTHALTALVAVMMNTLVIVGLIFRPRGRVLLGLSWISLGIFLLYIANTWVLFSHGGGARAAAVILPLLQQTKRHHRHQSRQQCGQEQTPRIDNLLLEIVAQNGGPGRIRRIGNNRQTAPGYRAGHQRILEAIR